MDDNQILVLTTILGKGIRLAWCDPSGPMREIVSIGMRGEEPKEPAGNFSDGTYCALWAVCPEDVVMFDSVFKENNDGSRPTESPSGRPDTSQSNLGAADA